MIAPVEDRFFGRGFSIAFAGRWPVL